MYISKMQKNASFLALVPGIFNFVPKFQRALRHVGDGLVAVTLGAGCAIRLQRNRRHEAGAPIHTLWLPPRSALVVS